jgi:hypothetical protein
MVCARGDIPGASQRQGSQNLDIPTRSQRKGCVGRLPGLSWIA